MKRSIIGVVIGLIVGTVASVGAQGSLSNQVLRLLTRENEWTNTNTFSAESTATLKLERAGGAASTCVDRFENRGGNLYFNCLLVVGSSGSGTVTSVAMTVPGIFSVAGTPVQTTGTLAISLATQAANLVWAGPTTGSAATPTFRALVDNDVPDTITIAGTNTVTWASVNKTGSSLLDLATRSATDLSSGTLPDGRFPATLPASSGLNLTSLNATNLGSGTVACARMPALTGDATTSAGACAVTLANTAVTPASYTLASITVDAKGRITAASNGTAGAGTVTHTSTALTAGALVLGNGTADIKVLGDVGTATTLLHGQSAGVFSFTQVKLAADVDGLLSTVNGGTGFDSSAVTNGQLMVGKTSDHTWNLATLTGTANQITVTNGGGSITLSLPQAIATGSTPQFARLGLGTAAGASALITGAGQLDLGYFDDGNCGATDTINWNSGEAHKSTLTAATCTYTFSNPIAGRRYTIVVTQDGTGSRLVAWPVTVTWKGGSAPTLTTTASKRDICYFTWNGTEYLGNCDLNY